jgi:hypothetical protein
MSLSRLGWLCLALFALTSIAPGQQVGQPLQGPGIPAPIIADRDAAANLSATDAWYANHEMRLRSDGNLPGQLRSFDVAGNLTPVRARLFFIQNGQIIGRATADEHGRFQAVGLDGGPYSVVAAGPEGFGAFSLRVLKNDGTPNVTPPKVKSIGKYKEASDVKVVANQPGGDPLMLDISVIGPNDFPLIAQIIRDQVPGLSLPGAAPVAPAGLGGGGAGVGGGGGGGFGGALGAAAAIGGVGALLGTSRNSNTASSSTGS